MSKQHIHVIYEHPPIPSRDFDWRAYWHGEEEAGEYGYGFNPTTAVASLLMLMPGDSEVLSEKRNNALSA